ncbi:MAG: dephospho-CoA kinase [Pirellulales bacterium]|nr:dephospho-CoA kinase [Pirellulales bacterium]
MSSPPVRSPSFAKLKIIGLLGGVAGGKSWVARCLARCGAGVLDADRTGHEALQDSAVQEKLRERWGATVFGPDGTIDRVAVAERVFAPPPEGPRDRAFLEKLLHPEIARRLERQAEELSAAGRSAAVLDAPLLLEAGWDRFCDCLLFVDAPEAVRRQRALARGWSEKQFTARQKAQQAPESKRARADAVIDNGGPPEETQARVDRWWAEFCNRQFEI